MTSLLKMLCELFGMCLLSARVWSKAPNANCDFESPLRHFKNLALQ
jgi:hypothetical protein